MVSGSLSADEGSELGQPSAPHFTYTERFYEAFPYYLSIGMSAEQYWNGDPSLARYYRKAEEIRNEKRNKELWLQGIYFYEALCDASPLFRSLSKKGTRAQPYPDHPYALTDKDAEAEKERKAKNVSSKGKSYMMAMMASTNKRFAEKSDTP